VAPPTLPAGVTTEITVEPDPVDEAEDMFFGYEYGLSECPQAIPRLNNLWHRGFAFQSAVKARTQRLHPTNANIGEQLQLCSYQGPQGTEAGAVLTGSASVEVVAKPTPTKPKPKVKIKLPPIEKIVERPSTFNPTVDGSFYATRLRWHMWGSAFSVTTGIFHIREWPSHHFAKIPGRLKVSHIVRCEGTDFYTKIEYRLRRPDPLTHKRVFSERLRTPCDV
jgi:hypothetical protein